MLLDKIRFKEAIITIPKDFELEFKSKITLLVGDNGCGKSTILDAIRSHFEIADPSYMKRDYRSLEVSPEIAKESVMYFDSHAMDKKFSGTFGDDMNLQLKTMRLSSGQGLLTQMIERGFFKAKKKVIILDEPCRGLSLKKQYLLFEGFMQSCMINDNQLILSTHSEVFMRLAKLDPCIHYSCSLFSVEAMRYMTYEEFIESQKSEL